MGSVHQIEREPIERRSVDSFADSERIIGTFAVLSTSIEQPTYAGEDPATLDVVDQAIRIAKNELAPSIEYISIKDLESQYHATHDLATEASKCGLFTLSGGEKIKDLSGYNLTQPIYDVRYDPDTGKPYVVIGMRMEKLEDEFKSKTEFFRANNPFSTSWEHIEDEELPDINGQDPSITKIGEQLLLGVVEVKKISDDESDYIMAFYMGSNIRDLEIFAYGPSKMKDICQAQLLNGRVINFTRPQSGDPSTGGLGQIGEVTVDRIDEIKDPEVLQNAELINTRFLDDEWGGVGQAIALQDNKVGLIFHGARFDNDHAGYPNKYGHLEKPKIYHTLSGVYNPDTRKIEDVQIIAMAEEFGEFTPKKEVLRGVAFGKGITEPNEEGDVMLVLGIGDALPGYKIIKDPFAGRRLVSSDELIAA